MKQIIEQEIHNTVHLTCWNLFNTYILSEQDKDAITNVAVSEVSQSLIYSISEDFRIEELLEESEIVERVKNAFRVLENMKEVGENAKWETFPGKKELLDAIGQYMIGVKMSYEDEIREIYEKYVHGAISMLSVRTVGNQRICELITPSHLEKRIRKALGMENNKT